MFDRIGTIFIVRKAGKIIGGARTIASTPTNPNPLPLEAEGFSLKRSLPRLQLEYRRYAEISRLAILPEHRHGGVSEYLIRFMLAFLEYQDTDYLFTNAPLVQARSYRKIIGGLGYNYTILTELKMPVHPLYASLRNVVLSVSPFNQRVHIEKILSNSEFVGIGYQPQVDQAA